MARSRLEDVLSVYPFWIFDAGVLGGNVLFPALDPAMAFNAASSPEISIEHKEIAVGNWQFSRRVVKRASVSPITLSRGVRFWDSDFYNWALAAIMGKDPVRRSLCMIHFLGIRSSSSAGQIVGGAVAGALQGGIAGAAGGAILGQFIDNRIPGKVWMLHDSLPTRYKAGGDFDASSGAVSVQELEIQPEHIVEIGVGVSNPIATGAITGAIGVAKALF